MPLWRARGTPQLAFYRLYEALCTGDGQMIAYETEYFWRQSSSRLATANVPDPQCPDPEQYAVMALLAEILVESFIWRLELGLRRDDTPIMNRYNDPPPLVPETCPPWTAKVPSSKEKLVMHPREDEYLGGLFTVEIFTCQAASFTRFHRLRQEVV
jgi:hypothetical protein